MKGERGHSWSAALSVLAKGQELRTTGSHHSAGGTPVRGVDLGYEKA